MNKRRRFLLVTGCAVPHALFLGAVLVGCSPSGDTRKEPPAATDEKSTADRLAEVEQTYAAQAGKAKPMDSAAYVTTRVEGVPEKAVPGKEYRARPAAVEQHTRGAAIGHNTCGVGL